MPIDGHTDDFDGSLAVDDVTAALEELVSRGLERIDEMTDELLGLVRRRVPSFGDGRTRLETQDLRTAIRRAANVLLVCVRDGRLPADPELVSLTLIGTQRAREGVAEEDVVEALRRCAQGVLTFLLRTSQTGRELSTKTAFEAAALIAAQLNDCMRRVETAIGAGYAEFGEQIEQRGGLRNEASLANLILDKRWQTESELRTELARVGRPLGKVHGVIVVVRPAKTDDRPLAEVARELGERLGVTAILEATRWTRPAHVPIVLSASSSAEWRNILEPSGLGAAAAGLGVVAIFSEAVGNLADLAGLYLGIRRDLGFLRAARSEPGAVSSRRLDLFAVIAGDGRDIGRMTQLVQRVLGPIEQQTNADELMAVVRAYYRSNGVWQRVVEDLGLHRNTLISRVEKIQRLTGLDFRDVSDVHELMTISRLREFLDGEFLMLDSGDVVS